MKINFFIWHPFPLSLIFLWFFRQMRAIFFWLYLWQLKEYHLGRFLDHFRTEKGKRIFLSKIFLLKIFLFLYALIAPLYLQKFYPRRLIGYLYGAWIIILVFLYFFETAKFFSELFKREFKKPVLTKKTTILISANLIFLIGFFFFSLSKREFYYFILYLLFFDIFTPFIVTAIVFFFQPLVVLMRNQIIEKAKEKRALFKDLLVIGITGSYGKTSTKEFLATILAEKFKVLKTKEHQNSEMGISQCILNDLKSEHQIFVVEMAAYNRGGIKLLSDIARPKIGIITGVNEQHLATFGSLENLLSAEGGEELIESLPENGLAIFNGSNPYTLRLYLKTKKPKKVYRHQIIADQVEADIFAKDIQMEKDSLSLKVYPKKGRAHFFKVKVLGAQNVGNILAAILVARELKLTWKEIARGIEKIKPEQGAALLRKGINGLNIIDATYSANPDGVIADLDYLKIYPRRSKKIIVMPCLIELGQASGKIHKRIGREIAKICDLAIITTKERLKEIREGALEGRGESASLKPEKILFLENPEQIFEKIRSFSQKGDVVLLEGRVPASLLKKLIVD